MKSKDLQKVGLSKYHNGHKTTKIHRDLNGWDWFNNNQTVVTNNTSVWLYQIVKSTRWSTFRNNEGQNIQKVKHPFTPKEKSISSKTIDGPSNFREKCSTNNEKRFRATFL